MTTWIWTTLYICQLSQEWKHWIYLCRIFIDIYIDLSLSLELSSINWCINYHGGNISSMTEICLVWFQSSYIFYYCSSTVFCLFPPPQPNPPALTTSLPFPPSRRYCPCLLYNCSCEPFNLFSLIPPIPSLVAVSLFPISVALVIFCLFV